jgi:hypothetical protein
MACTYVCTGLILVSVALFFWTLRDQRPDNWAGEIYGETQEWSDGSERVDAGSQEHTWTEAELPASAKDR